MLTCLPDCIFNVATGKLRGNSNSGFLQSDLLIRPVEALSSRRVGLCGTSRTADHRDG